MQEALTNLFAIISVIALAIIIFVQYIKIKQRKYIARFDTIIFFTGAPGTGKTKIGVDISVNNYLHNLKIYKIKSLLGLLFKKIKPRDVAPKLYSTIPILIKKGRRRIHIGKFTIRKGRDNQWAEPLTKEILFMKAPIPEKSILFIDEIGSMLSQWDFKVEEVLSNFDEFIRLFRHYTKGGAIICTDQCEDNAVLVVRRRISNVYKLQGFKNYFKIMYSVDIANYQMATSSTPTQQNIIKTFTSLAPVNRYYGFFGRKKYDTYCYSERYYIALKVGHDVKTLYESTKKYNNFKTMYVFKANDVKKSNIDDILKLKGYDL